MKKTKQKLVLIILILMVALCSCEVQPASSNSKPSDTGESSAVNSADEKAKEEKFLYMANHDNYIIGTIVESHLVLGSDGFYADNDNSYIMIESEGKEYRLEGLLWNRPKTQTLFSIDCSQSLGEQYIKGTDIVVFYNPDEVKGNVIRPKDFHTPAMEQSVQDIVRGIPMIAQRLIDNYYAVGQSMVITPQEAVMAVAKQEGWENIEEKYYPDKVIYYQCEDIIIEIEPCISFNETFGMTVEEMTEYFTAAYPKHARSKDREYLSKLVGEKPYIFFSVHATKMENGEPVWWKDYRVHSSGEVEILYFNFKLNT